MGGERFLVYRITEAKSFPLFVVSGKEGNTVGGITDRVGQYV